ncbi:toll/interleukin-1 receptor domain-containing protein, partial [Shouchella clausii]
MKSINVFISYAWESKEIEKFAQWLGFFLDKYGISIKLDKFEVYPGSNLQKYMRDGLNKSKYVLCIVTDAYKAKMVDPDTGVYTETQHIEQMAG